MSEATKKPDLVGLFEAYENALRAEETLDKQFSEVAARYSELMPEVNAAFDTRRARRQAFVDALKAVQSNEPDAST